MTCRSCSSSTAFSRARLSWALRTRGIAAAEADRQRHFAAELPFLKIAAGQVGRASCSRRGPPDRPDRAAAPASPIRSLPRPANAVAAQHVEPRQQEIAGRDELHLAALDRPAAAAAAPAGGRWRRRWQLGQSNVTRASGRLVGGADHAAVGDRQADRQPQPPLADQHAADAAEAAAAGAVVVGRRSLQRAGQGVLHFLFVAEILLAGLGFAFERARWPARSRR